MSAHVVCGDALALLKTMSDESVHCCVTSPPYWGLRDYKNEPQVWGGDVHCQHTFDSRVIDKSKPGTAGSGLTDKGARQALCNRFTAEHGFCRCGAWRGSLGLEPTVELYVDHIVMVFREVKRVLRTDGTLWLNLGDLYAGSAQGWGHHGTQAAEVKQRTHAGSLHQPEAMANKTGFERPPNDLSSKQPNGLKPKDLVGIPWRVALALQADGWWLRQDIIWCLAGGTRVYAKTQKGVTPSSIKDLVRLRPDTVALWNGQKWTRVKSWRKSAPTDTIELELRSGERIGCTLGHGWPTTRGIVKAADLLVGDILESIKLPDEWRDGPIMLASSRIAFVVGLYLAEGSWSGKTIQFSLHADEQHLANAVSEWAFCYGGSCHIHEYGKTLSVCAEGRVLGAILDLYVTGRSAQTKRLTNACWRRDDKFLRDLLDGYLGGSGQYDKQNDRWRLGFPSNDALAADLRTVCARLSYPLRLHGSTVVLGEKTQKTFRGEIRTNKSTHHTTKPDTEIVAIRLSKERQFWDVEVEDEPHLFALASGVLTHNSKLNPMPEPVTDRCTKAHEYLFVLTKSARYFYDAEAIKENGSMTGLKKPAGWANGTDHSAIGWATPERQGRKTKKQRGPIRRHDGFNDRWDSMSKAEQCALRVNKRSVWTIATQPYKEAHFATFPEKLVEPCILAGTSEHGVCPKCGAPWKRRIDVSDRNDTTTNGRPAPDNNVKGGEDQAQKTCATGERTRRLAETTGWQPTCTCGSEETVACIVLDPFCGSGTVGVVALHHNRGFLGIELNPSYVEMARARIVSKEPLFRRDT